MNHKSNRKCVLSTAKVGERGQIVIPKDIRDLFDIQSGDTLIIRGLEGKGGPDHEGRRSACKSRYNERYCHSNSGR